MCQNNGGISLLEPPPKVLRGEGADIHALNGIDGWIIEPTGGYREGAAEVWTVVGITVHTAHRNGNVRHVCLLRMDDIPDIGIVPAAVAKVKPTIINLAVPQHQIPP
mmetsp:Transcript_59766/g.69855  ORF Transcript_59766/g.69855 Transcript_59766/m.69855 type:complete len:107 (-) Transcript_59766:433-753(-)